MGSLPADAGDMSEELQKSFEKDVENFDKKTDAMTPDSDADAE